MYGNHPLRNVAHIHAHDVLCGRGGGTNAHVGNAHWRMLVAANKELYVSLPKKQKMLLSKSIVNAVRSQNPPGRFLQKDNKTNLWYDVGDQRAQEKTSQALREGAPVIRSKNNKESGSDEDDDDDEQSVSPEKSQALTDEKSPKVARVHSGNIPVTSPVIPVQQYSTQMMPSGPPVYMNPASSMGMIYTPQPPQYPFPSPHSINPLPPHGAPPVYAPNHPAGPYPPIILNPHGMPHGMVAIPAPVPAQGPVPDRNRKPKSPTKKKDKEGGSGDDKETEAKNSSKANSPQQESHPPPSHPSSQQSRSSHNNNRTVEPISYVQLDPRYPQQKQYENTQEQSVFYEGEQSKPMPPAILEDQVGCSFGSIAMSEVEHARLLDGSVSAYNQGGMPQQHYNGAMNHYNQIQQQQHYENYQSSYPGQVHQYRQDSYSSQPPPRPPRQQQQQQETPSQSIMRNEYRNGSEISDLAPLPVDGGLDGGVGFSFGSIMSLEAPKLDGGVGLSFGSAMSYSMRGDIAPPDGGLEAIGTSFGSMSLMESRPQPVDGGLDGVGTSFGSFSLSQDRDKLVEVPPQVANEDEAALCAQPPSFRQQKSKGSLLECSDTDSDDEASGSARSARKSEDWQKLQDTWAAQKIPHASHIPPSLGPGSSSQKQSYYEVPRHVPATHLGRDFSQMSAISVGDFNENDHYQVMPTAGYPNGDNSYPSSSPQNDMNAMPPPPPAVRKHDDDDLWRSEGDQYQQAFGGS
ncbi:hypothetical protein FisN_21Lh132 [Fistulifera solaris]|uniref:DUF6824 domain-containing protein n=1 Tax=Fistulifera solaris TaxID=1519565 RepID=A0A1Z5J8V4_FISSO|nr:hypothetical protein FisN_21Lh132 [Fistulifera solaris]|eukprot:GAX10433.1 hypothetical protein FisN_21Lh132 [Fistulifera solaris]